jgi:hypothetical protein
VVEALDATPGAVEGLDEVQEEVVHLSLCLFLGAAGVGTKGCAFGERGEVAGFAQGADGGLEGVFPHVEVPLLLLVLEAAHGPTAAAGGGGGRCGCLGLDRMIVCQLLSSLRGPT